MAVMTIITYLNWNYFFLMSFLCYKYEERFTLPLTLFIDMHKICLYAFEKVVILDVNR